jgi:antitoxin MazE
MQVLVKKWGNSASVRIPSSVMDAAGLTLDQKVDIREEDGRIVIEPLRDTEVTLEELLAGITDDNMHDPIEFWPPVGKEIF